MSEKQPKAARRRSGVYRDESSRVRAFNECLNEDIEMTNHALDRWMSRGAGDALECLRLATPLATKRQGARHLAHGDTVFVVVRNPDCLVVATVLTMRQAMNQLGASQCVLCGWTWYGSGECQNCQGKGENAP